MRLITPDAEICCQGLVLNGLKEHVLHNDIGPEDVHFHFSGVRHYLYWIDVVPRLLLKRLRLDGRCGIYP